MDDNYDSGLETLEHIAVVKQLMQKVINGLKARAETHDASKLVEPELSVFNEYSPERMASQYGSDQYYENLASMKVALDHHYANNSHHPQHFENGIEGMNLLDIMEMLCDWKASTERYSDGDIAKSIEINQERFGFSDEMKQIMLNTLSALS